MPLKAFAVTSLRASGVKYVEGMKPLGANIRTGLGIRPRARDE